ncbi:hypothetical protein COT72_03675 [archaeon CG10_big_fil_rev_8_21_14_0_10_43_11]|nr:MAG: hypothetical protein COT72_03675 [archaeon CG10_big_fil_rev_8_21_14_0_10_43_11]
MGAGGRALYYLEKIPLLNIPVKILARIGDFFTRGGFSAAKRSSDKNDMLYYQSGMIKTQKKMADALTHPQLKQDAQQTLTKLHDNDALTAQLLERVMHYNFPQKEKEHYKAAVTFATGMNLNEANTQMVSVIDQDLRVREGEEKQEAKNFEAYIANPHYRDQLTTWDIIKYLELLANDPNLTRNQAGEALFDTKDARIKQVFDLIQERDAERIKKLNALFEHFQQSGINELFEQLGKKAGEVSKALKKFEMVITNEIEDQNVAGRLGTVETDIQKRMPQLNLEVKEQLTRIDELKKIYTTKEKYPQLTITKVLHSERILFDNAIKSLNKLTQIKNELEQSNQLVKEPSKELSRIFSFDAEGERLANNLTQTFQKLSEKTQKTIQNIARTA